uniref:Large ribosomal subunit protein uL22c n=6 Tax=Schisandraceae TaxID=16733 RepID=A0A5Q2ZZP2_9MAGN|nr:ribosomal protein L22 [Kadsura ananosma]QGI24923.1 ribosomal protein L22 [Kadsura coccinea]QRG30466.1 ribosomal protein L22 [Kadsura ananosma]
MGCSSFIGGRWNFMIKRRSRTEVKALAQYICMSPHKARRIIDQIRGRSYRQTLMILDLMPYRAAYHIFKLVYSAGANARHNKGLSEVESFISKAEVNGGAIVKKFKPRARGRSYPIKRPTCHITIVVNTRYILLNKLYQSNLFNRKKFGL